MGRRAFVGPLPQGAGLGDDGERIDIEGSLVAISGRSEYAEAASRGRIFEGMNAVAGTTLVAGNVQPPAAAAATVITLWNPLSSKYDLELAKAWLTHISGTPAAGMWMWCVSAGNTITAAPNNQGVAERLPIASDGSGTAGAGRIFVQTALTGGLVHTLLRPFPCAMFAGAIGATTPLNYFDEVRGAIVVKPGGLLTLAPTAVGTTHVVHVGLSWQEVLRT